MWSLYSGLINMNALWMKIKIEDTWYKLLLDKDGLWRRFDYCCYVFLGYRGIKREVEDYRNKPN
jgi:hypothetical protein